MAAQHVRHRFEHFKINDPLSIRVNRQWIIVVVVDDDVVAVVLAAALAIADRWLLTADAVSDANIDIPAAPMRAIRNIRQKWLTDVLTISWNVMECDWVLMDAVNAWALSSYTYYCIEMKTRSAVLQNVWWAVSMYGRFLDDYLDIGTSFHSFSSIHVSFSNLRFEYSRAKGNSIWGKSHSFIHSKVDSIWANWPYKWTTQNTKNE